MLDVVPMFSTPIGIEKNFISENERKDLYNDIEKINHYDHGALEGNAKSTKNNKSIKLNENIMLRLKQAITDYTNIYGLDGTLKIAEIWTNIQNKGSKLIEHTHPDSVISGALYINTESNSKIYFHNPNPYIMFTQVPSNKNEYNSQYYWFNVLNCQLFLFPSWLKHGKNDIVNDMNNRIVISFNVIRDFIKQKKDRL
jgi:uncharacterized protein (TIGR02466 family)